jgi:hypothetical protein
MTAAASTARLDVRYENTGGDHVRGVVDVFDPSLLGHRAELRIIRRVKVHDSRAVNSSEKVFTAPIPSLAARNEIAIPRSAVLLYSYQGSMIDIEVTSEVAVDDGVLFDTKIVDDEKVGLWAKPEVSTNAKEMIEPKDAFDFIANLRAIPPKNQVITLALALVAGILIAINSWVGIHDQFVPASATWFYDHVDSDGDSESPLFKSLAGSGALGLAVWMAMRQQLRKYMTFGFTALPERICAADALEASSLFHGVSRVDLDHVVLRVVACNMEKGQYKRGSGTKERTVSFSEPVRAVMLYERRIQRIPAGVPVENSFDGTISFEPMFRALYPPQMVSSNHGLSVHWEVQLIHEQFIDQELVGPIECFPWEEFLDA